MEPLVYRWKGKDMFWFCVWQVISTLIELIRLGRRSASEKDFEILLLRRQLAIHERRQERAPHLQGWGEDTFWG
jgi:hypothetical protein